MHLDSESSKNTDADTNSDTDSDVDADTDADTDSDVDTDTDADTDSDVDADTDADTDSDVDADTDADTDSAVDLPCSESCYTSAICTILEGTEVAGVCDAPNVCCDLGGGDADTDVDTDVDSGLPVCPFTCVYGGTCSFTGGLLHDEYECGYLYECCETS